MTVLTATTGLSLVLRLVVNLLADGLLVCNLRVTYIRLNLELAQKSVDDDLQVKFAHAGDDGLSGLFIRIGTEGRVFLSELRQCDAHLFLTCLRLRLDSDANDRFGEFH